MLKKKKKKVAKKAKYNHLTEKPAYLPELRKALKACGAEQGMLLVVDGNKGVGCASQLSEEAFMETPRALRHIASEMEAKFLSMMVERKSQE
jgi:hypothetical protein